ncbi:MAG: fluoride efflux transporter CrcB [Gemmatimonadota bacterium]
MLTYIYIAVGSAAGGVLRYIVGNVVQRQLDPWAPRSGGLPFPIGTLVVNVTGAFLLGVILIVSARYGEGARHLRLLLAVGLCGGYTTFSSFSGDTIGLLENGGTGLAALNVVASVGLSLLATFAGVMLARGFYPRPL